MIWEMEIQMTKNIHLEHPEDTILNGDLSILNWFLTPGHLSLKVDGSPSLVWGTDPSTGDFFVGTKSVFNKKKIKICYTQADVFALYGEQPALVEILCACLKYLPRTEKIYQGDWIGFGGSDEYTPNTITYKFPEVIRHTIIISPHTEYVSTGELKDAQVAGPIDYKINGNDQVLFVQPEAYIFQNQESFEDVRCVVEFARQMSQTVTFVNGKQLAELKKQLNAAIREGREIEDDAFDCDPNLIRFWKLVKSIKDDCLFLCRNLGPDAYIGYNRIDAEGYVMVNKYGMYKLVNREVFSCSNFNLQKNWNK
jgi:hypothetical protein